MKDSLRTDIRRISSPDVRPLEVWQLDLDAAPAGARRRSIRETTLTLTLGFGPGAARIEPPED